MKDDDNSNTKTKVAPMDTSDPDFKPDFEGKQTSGFCPNCKNRIVK